MWALSLFYCELPQQNWKLETQFSLCMGEQGVQARPINKKGKVVAGLKDDSQEEKGKR